MRSDVFQAIAYPTRCTLLILIILHEMIPNAIADHFDGNRPGVSMHKKLQAECFLPEQKQKR